MLKPQNNNRDSCYMITRNMIYILMIMRDAILLDSFLNSKPNLPNESTALVFNIFLYHQMVIIVLMKCILR